MINFSQLIAARDERIITEWMEAVRQDKHLKSDDTLSLSAIRDHLPLVLKAIATVLSRSEESDLQILVDASFQHGVVRAQQGFDPVEIAREYRLLRRAIFTALEPELIGGSAIETYRAFRLIDMVVDEAIAQCFKSYMGERMQELEQLQQHLTMTGQEIDRLVRANQDNLSSLTDELKVRLNTIVGYSELFLRQQQKQTAEAQSAGPKLEHIERVLRNGRHLLQLINDAAELSRYESGKLKLHLMTTDVRGMIREIVQVAEPSIAAKKLTLNVDYETAPAQILTDPLRLHQIIANLISNAIRFTEAGTVQVHCQALPPDRWSITVSDTGMGISPDDRPHIFDLYFQAESLAQSSSKRKGLGLAIVSRLVALLQGEISVTSDVGVGSTFTVHFPLTVTLPDSDSSEPT